MNKHLLLALLFIPMAACGDANADTVGSGSDVTLKRYDFTSDDIVPSRQTDERSYIQVNVPNGAIILGGEACEVDQFDQNLCRPFAGYDDHWEGSVSCRRVSIEVDPQTSQSVLRWTDDDNCKLLTLSVVIAY